MAHLCQILENLMLAYALLPAYPERGAVRKTYPSAFAEQLAFQQRAQRSIASFCNSTNLL